MAHFYLRGLLLFLLLIVTSVCRDDSPVTETVAASPEEDVLLPCFNPNVMYPKSCYRVKWIKYATDASQMKVILARPEAPNFRDAKRAGWVADGNGQMSLFLTKLQKSDAGLYSCEVWQGWDCILVKNISLKLKECKTLPAVKAVLSTPINLNCPMDITPGQQGPRNISWALMKGSNPVPYLGEINGTSVAIQSMNNSDSGWYRCKYMLGQTQRCFDINLLVRENNVVVTSTVPALTVSEVILKSTKEERSGAFIVAVSSVIIGIALIPGLIVLFIYRRRNTQRIAQLTLRNPPDSTGFYEIVNLTSSADPTNQQVNSLYQEVEEESMCTFHY